MKLMSARPCRADRVAASERLAREPSARARLARAVGRIERLEDRRLMSVSLATAVTTPLSATPAGDPAAPVIADFDNDARPDVIVAFPANSAITTGSIQVGRGDGTGAFQLSTAIDVGRFTGRPAVGDFDGDRLLDLAVTDAFGGQVKVLRNITEVGGNATDPVATIAFAPAVAFAAGVSPEALAVADFNVDNRADLVVGNRSDNTVQVRLGGQTSLLGDAVTLNTAADPASLATGDFNLDDTLDVLVGASGGTGATAGTLQVFNGNGDGTFNTTPIATTGPKGVTAVADINNDSALDVIVGVDDRDRVDALVNTGNGTFTLTRGSTGQAATKAAVAVDLDENRRPDVLTAVAGQIDVLPGNGNGTFGRVLAFDAAGGSGPAVADVTGDGRPDVLTVTATPGTAAGRTLNVSVGQRVGPELTVQLVSALPPAALVGGRGEATVRVTNNGPEAVNGPVVLQVLASANDDAFDELDSLLLQTSPKLRLRAGQGKNVRLRYSYEADAGTYGIAVRLDPFAETGDLNPANNTVVAPTEVNVAQPFVDLSGAFPAAPPLPATLAVGQKGTVSLTVTSAGNVVATGRLSLTLTASLDNLADAGDPVVRTIVTRVRLAPGASRTFRFKFRLPDVPAGSYNLLGVIDPTEAVPESNEENNVAVSPTKVTITPAT